jgi:hypothetical protein
MKFLILAALLLSLIVELAFASALDPAENKYIHSLNAKNMEALVSAEQEISKLSKNDRELVLFTASAYLNQKFSNLGNIPTASDLDYRQRAYVMAVAVGRLQLLSHMTGFQGSAECYSVESTGLLAISRGENATPSNCRLQLYGPEVQGRHASEARSPKDSPLAELSNRWATSAMLNGMYSGELYNYGKSNPEYLSLQGSSGKCEDEFKAISRLPIIHYEAVYLEASNQVLSWFVGFNERKNISPWEEKWSYLTWSKSASLMGKNATKSARLEAVLLGFGKNAAAFIRKEKSFDQYMDSNASLALTLDKIGRLIILDNPSLPSVVKGDGKKLSDCVIASAGASARSELISK